MDAKQLIGLCFFMGFLGLVTSIHVDNITLANNQQVLQYDSDDKSDHILECNINLQEGEVLQQVKWKFTDYNGQEVGGYTWDKKTGGKTSGVLQTFVNLVKKDLQFMKKLSFELAGFYTCSATTTNGRTVTSLPFELLVVATGPQKFGSSNNASDPCATIVSISTGSMYPDPTIKMGIWSYKLDKFYSVVPMEKIPKTVHTNKTVSYNFEKSFTVDNTTAVDASIHVDVGFTKKDGTFVNVMTSTSMLTNLHDKGCPVLTGPDNSKISYDTDKRTCRGELKTKFFSDEVRANVSCAEGYRRNSIILTCKKENDTLKWGPPNMVGNLNKMLCRKSSKITDNNSSVRASDSLRLVMVMVMITLFSLIKS